jgi:hypothetical protein
MKNLQIRISELRVESVLNCNQFAYFEDRILRAEHHEKNEIENELNEIETNFWN